MAEFCEQCAATRNEPSDFSGMTTEGEWSRGLARVVICEGCGPVFVDPKGRCAGSCLEGHSIAGEFLHKASDETRTPFCGHGGDCVDRWSQVTCPFCKAAYVKDMEDRGVFEALEQAGLWPPP